MKNNEILKIISDYDDFIDGNEKILLVNFIGQF